jgi:hypothetical protein
MNESWTDAERLSAEISASGSDEVPHPVRPTHVRDLPSHLAPGWPDSSLFQTVVDAAVVIGALVSIFIGARRLIPPVTDARPLIAQALEGISIPSAVDLEPAARIATITAADRPVTAGEPMSLPGRALEASIGRYRSVAGMHAERKLPCSQLRQNYTEVEDAWIGYSVARGRTYGDRLPDRLVQWDAALYQAVQDVDRDFTASGCSRL